MTLPEVLNELLKAESNPKRFFQDNPEKILRDWQSKSHPDRFEDKELANSYFVRFGLAFERINKKLPKINLKGKEYTLTDSPIIGDTSDVHINDVVIKVGRLKALSAQFAKNERECLKNLQHENFSRYLPKVLDSSLDVTIFEKPTERFVKLSDFKDLEPRHGAWLTKRLLEIMGFAHNRGITHGGIVPDNILVFPKNHGILLLDWKFGGEKEVKKSKKYQHLYPQDKEVSRETDIYMIFKTIESISGKLPPPIKSFFKGCTQETQSMRPDKCWGLHEELSTLLKKVYGPPKFLELVV